MIFEEYQENYELTSLHDFDRFDFLWFDNPVNHYDLASIDCRVSSFEQLQYYAEVFLYLNPDITRKFLGPCSRTSDQGTVECQLEHTAKKEYSRWLT